ncbi:MAG: serine/threonine-protein kinase [Planctomycetota bacterium]
MVGDYRLLGRLGAGGMGAVWRAQHLATGATRALKVAVCTDPESLARFQREARALARLNHPHVARVHAAEVAQGVPYLVLDLAEGGDLADRLKRGPLPAEEARRVVLALADGLAHVHAAGILHRDLKPHNVVFDDEARPLLVDFGLARGLDTSSLTATGVVLGTPAYMAPEQLDDARNVDERADVYGLGAVLYSALTGVEPIAGKTGIDLLRAVIEDPPRPPRELRPDVPPALEALCLRALAKDPAARFASARELAQALAACDLRASGSRKRGVALARAGGLALALAALGWALRGGAPAQPPASSPLPGKQPARALPRAEAEEALVDRAFAQLEPPTPAELEGAMPPALYDAEELLAGIHASMLVPVGEQLATKRPGRELALYYWVARRGRELEDPRQRATSQLGWHKLAGRLRMREGEDQQTPSPELWSRAAWRRDRREVLRACLERAAEADHLEAWVDLGDLLRTPDPRVEVDVARAQACYRRALAAEHHEGDYPAQVLQVYRRLAEVAANHPDLDGRLGDLEALEYARAGYGALGEAGPEIYEATARAATTLAQRIAAAGEDPGPGPHLLDYYGRALPQVTAEDLERCDLLVAGERQSLLAYESSLALNPAVSWLIEQGELAQAGSLLYRCARANPDEGSQSAWFRLGAALCNPRGQPYLGLPRETPALERLELARECFRRSAAADHAGGWLALAGMAEGDAALGLEPVPTLALRYYLAAAEAEVADPDDPLAAWCGAGELCLREPGLPGRPSYRALLEALRAARDGVRDAHKLDRARALERALERVAGREE